MITSDKKRNKRNVFIKTDLDVPPKKPGRGNPNIVPRWKKGESGNPAGRPKGKTASGLRAQKILLTSLFLDYSQDDWENLMKILFFEAKNGNMKCLFFILENSLSRMIERAEDEIKEDLKTLTVEEITTMLSELQQKRRDIENTRVERV